MFFYKSARGKLAASWKTTPFQRGAESLHENAYFVHQYRLSIKRKHVCENIYCNCASFDCNENYV